MLFFYIISYHIICSLYRLLMYNGHLQNKNQFNPSKLCLWSPSRMALQLNPSLAGHRLTFADLTGWMAR